MSISGKRNDRPRMRIRVKPSERQGSAADTAAKAAAPPRATDDGYDVGYGRPPRHTQFKPGQSGNPRGRPKGAKSEADILNALLNRKITIQERGRARQITVMEGAYRAITQNALKGDLKAAAFLFNRKAQIDQAVAAPPSEMNEDDHAVLDSYIQQIISAQAAGGNDDLA
jgi:hypothetical protein